MLSLPGLFSEVCGLSGGVGCGGVCVSIGRIYLITNIVLNESQRSVRDIGTQ